MSDKVREMFISNIAHELRSPLSTMLMHAEMLKAGDLGAEEQKKTGEAIARATTRLTQTIDDLVDVAKAMSGTLSHQPQPASLTSIVKTAVNYSGQVAKRGVTFSVEAAGTTGDVLGDVARLSQVVRHLLSNAARFSPKGATVAVSVVEEGDDLVVRVKDAGPGVEAAWLPFLFNRLSDPDAAGRPKPQGGIGYGLSIAQFIVARHGGTIALESSTPQGSVFKVSLPRRRAPRSDQ